LFDESLVDVGSLRWVLDELITLLGLSLLEESLTNTFVNDDQSDFWRHEGLNVDFFILFLSFFLGLGLLEESIFFSDDLVQLDKLLINDHLSH
jgi:hypothetical protein